MLLLMLQRDKTDKDPKIGNYTVAVKVTTSPTELVTLATTRIENFQRREGWLPLLRQAVRKFEEDDAYALIELLDQCLED